MEYIDQPETPEEIAELIEFLAIAGEEGRGIVERMVSRMTDEQAASVRAILERPAVDQCLAAIERQLDGENGIG